MSRSDGSEAPSAYWPARMRSRSASASASELFVTLMRPIRDRSAALPSRPSPPLCRSRCAGTNPSSPGLDANGMTIVVSEEIIFRRFRKGARVDRSGGGRRHRRRHHQPSRAPQRDGSRPLSGSVRRLDPHPRRRRDRASPSSPAPASDRSRPVPTSRASSANRRSSPISGSRKRTRCSTAASRFGNPSSPRSTATAWAAG